MTAHPKPDLIGVAASPEEATVLRARELWVTRKHSTYDIAKRLGMHESDVDRIVHDGRRRG